MFDSGFDQADLIFQDSAESLVPIPENKRNYKAWLGYQFLSRVRTLEWVAQNTDQSGMDYSTLSAINTLPFSALALCSVAMTIFALLNF